ncbi:7-carboxy-7-deazaguanine synthase QueE [Bacillus sp. SM2101]|uniref:7-carboxy-7-deazaguanine synthase QueE n=1 Tax=Bacillus sp. SM2101 TaxID=2805366 RepID=UPI001BDE2D16|nr:7-carboxy-7-deazaguanine synthase QueE [Bacillus sp. SM2101]
MKKTIPVLEIFGPTIQGEGMVIGQKTMFVRTAGCDYACSWCDSAFTWDGSAKNEIEQLTSQEIWQRLVELGGNRFDHVTISGGNPALLQNLEHLLILLKEKGVRVGLETQGSVWQDWFLLIDDLTISPKPPSSEMKTNFEKLDFIIDGLVSRGRQQHVSLKVVVFDDKDLEYAKMVHKRYEHIKFYLQVGNEDVLSEDPAIINKLLHKYEWLIQKTIDSAELNNVKVLPQLHTLVWGNKRGV